MVRGTVQGVGFRPFVYRHATGHGLAGWVRNTGEGVELEVEGERAALDAFVETLIGHPPPLARIEEVRATPSVPTGGAGFQVLNSRTGANEAEGGAMAEGGAGGAAAEALPVGPDAATCTACLGELRDPEDRRHRYPFINCTDCGPRFTIIRGLPYDRARTTMAAFELCDACRMEYNDPGDRRFHAEPVACPDCGPRMEWIGTGGGPGAGVDPISSAAAVLRAGGIIALKGLGGYQLACDAGDPGAVARLRQRKQRDAKPFAIMLPDLETARLLCRISEAEAAALTGARAPVVLVQRRSGAWEEYAGAVARDGYGSRRVAREVAPGLDTVGVMLPYTPLHHRLMESVGRPLVMTSGNRSGEPIAAGDQEALDRLGGIADGFLRHDREIASRYDDSVVRVDDRGDAMVLRRARGYAPEPIRLPLAAERPILAVGAQLKAAFCLVRGRQAFPSQHIGDLDDARTAVHFMETAALYRDLFRAEPACVAHDLHPDYVSTRYAEGFPEGVRRIGVQHHHAHAVSCLAEHGRLGPALGVCFDGAGYGPDGTIWGGELLLVDWHGYRRLSHLRHLAMPGGDAAAREPWRMAVAALVETFGSEADIVAAGLLRRIEARRRGPVLNMARRRVHAPLTSSAGRLFDAVAALVGIRDRNHYEGQAAMELEALVDTAEQGAYPLPLGDDGVWDSSTLVAAAVDDLTDGLDTGRVAARFHNGLAAGVAEACRRAREETGAGVVALSGGCFQNRRLSERSRSLLEADGFEVLTHRRVPANDGGIAFGQAAVAVAAQCDAGEEV